MVEGLHLEIAGTGAYLPEQVRGNDYFLGRTLLKFDSDNRVVGSKFMGDEEKDIVRVTGIRERRVPASGETSSVMGYKAALTALENSGVKADSIVGIVMASVSEQRNVPSGACKIQRDLGIKRCFTYDMQNACAGYPEALAQVNARVLKRPGNYMVVASEDLIRMTDDDINSTLFGAGAGAVVLTPTEGPRGILAEYSLSNPFEGRDKLIFRSLDDKIRMPEGHPVYKQAIEEMLGAVNDLKRQLGWDCADVVVPHQANSRIIDKIAERSPQGVVVCKYIEKIANVSSATCAISLDMALRDGTIKRSSYEGSVLKFGSRVIVVAFGGGTVTSGVAIQF